MKFKELELKEEGSWIKRKINSKHVQKSLTFMVIGAIGGFAYFYFTEGKNMESISINQIFSSMFIGGLLGLFITNSPCARGKC